jgi:methyl-accepting chemotaxis protein
MKIRTKLLALLGVLVVVVVFLVATMVVRSSSVMLDIANIEAQDTTEDLTSTIDTYFIGLNNIVNNAKPGVIDILEQELSKNPNAAATEHPMLDNFMDVLLAANKEAGVTNVYVGLEKEGSLHIGSGYVPPADYDSRKRPWYMAAAAAKKTTVTQPYVDSDSGKVVISSVTPIYGKSGAFLGVLAADVFLEALAVDIRTANILGAGFGVLLTSDGMILEHPKQELIATENITKQSNNITSELAAVGAAAVSGKPGWGDYRTADGEKHRIYYTKSKSGYIAALALSHEQINAMVRRVTLTPMIVGSAALIFIIIIMLILIPGITRPVEQVRRALERMAALDLTKDSSISGIERKLGVDTELGLMIIAMKKLRRTFNEIIVKVSDSVSKVDSAAQKLETMSHTVNGEIANTSEAMSSAREHSNSALEKLDVVFTSLGEVSSTASITAESAVSGAEASSDTSRHSREVADIMDAFVAEMGQVGDVSAENSKQITELGASVDSITEFVTTIGNIAKQTNLLALNAAIEAARAGDAGRGFAVVAEEVRNLAEESNQTSSHVAEMIEKLRAGTGSAIESTQRTSEIVTNSAQKAGTARQSLRETENSIGRMNDAVQTIAATAEEQAASSSEVLESTNSVKEYVADIVREMTSVDESTKTVSDTIHHISDEADNLYELAEDLAKIMADFKV